MKKLTERLYNNTTRVFWHGGGHEGWDREKSSYKCFYMTPSFEYAAQYSKRDNYNFGVMLACSIARPLNLFDPRRKEDQDIIKAYFNKDSESAVNSFLRRLATLDWVDVMTLEKRQKFLGLLVKLGYDGFINTEADTQNISLGIFDYNNVKVHRAYRGHQVKDFILSDPILKQYYENERQLYLEDSDPYPDDYVLLDKDDFEELNLRKSW